MALGIALCGAEPDEVEERLQIYEAVRRKRASAVQLISNAGVDQVEYLEEEIMQYID